MKTVVNLARHGILAGLCLSGGMLCAAEQYQALEQVQTAAREFVLRQMAADGARQGEQEVSTGALDPRLQLSRCATPLEAFAANGTRYIAGAGSVGVRCAAPKPWSVYVPVQVTRYAEVVVAARSLARGTQLAADDVRLARREIRGATDYFTDVQHVIGKQVKRPLGGDAVLTAQVIELPRLVRREQRVTILVLGEGVEVRMAGEARGDAAQGEPVKVRNLISKRIVEGVATAPGVVTVRP
ncbi:MAG: flagella basal body P-ring formation protein FlgA [Gammaproteobacteria bacterium]|nr:MAG: flagella basal body P-ring formation protein FlgA [Gammaproteobacteria bacterium]